MPRNNQRLAMAVAEIQGLYGPFSFPEKLLQKIWLRGDFIRLAARLTDGRRVSIVHPGIWNLLGGPDFREARLRIGDEPEVSGDVELHLHAADWAAHAHARDPAYDGVVLHVVLFPPPLNHETLRRDGRTIPILALLPLLHHDLEEFAAEEAVETLAGRTGQPIPAGLTTLAAGELKVLLQTQALARWRQKVHFARLRVHRLGWEAACHHTALEILGYRFNRAPMLRIAGRWPLVKWARGTVNVDDVFAAERGAWKVQGVRPANQPRTRLRQYAAWMTMGPNWPGDLASLASSLPKFAVASNTHEARRVHGFAALRKKFAAITGHQVGGTRLDNLVCDGFLPLLATLLPEGHSIESVWFSWFPGDLPPRLSRGLRVLRVGGNRAAPLAHGPAQGLLGWWLAHDARS